MEETRTIPTESAFWWVRLNGQPTVVKVTFQCQELWDKSVPWREVQISWPWGAGSLELGFMVKETGEFYGPMGELDNPPCFEWISPISWDDVPTSIYHEDAITALAGA